MERKAMRRALAVGDIVDIVHDPCWQGHWGVIVIAHPDDDEYHVSHGSIGRNLAPMFGARELKRRKTE